MSEASPAVSGARRVLHIITRLDVGGSSENVILSARESIRAGKEALIASGPSSAESEESREGGVPRVALPRLKRSIDPWSDLLAFFQILRLLRDWRPDIVHTHSSKAGVLGRWAAWLHRGWSRAAKKGAPRIVHTPHGHVFYGYFSRIKSGVYLAIERATARITDDLIALSEGEKRESLERGVGTPGQWSVIPSGVSHLGRPIHSEPEALAALPWSFPPGAVVAGCIARLEPVKGVEVLIEAAALVARDPRGSRARFLVIGDGDLMQPLRRRAQELGLNELVRFLGYQKSPELFLRSMDLYVQPSLNEGMGKTLVMAQAAGLPAIASRVCGIPDVVREGKTGVLVPPGDPDALAEAMLDLICNEPIRKSMGEAAARWVMELDETGHPRFSIEAMLSRLEALYNRNP